jgi:broad specificity phosphatase PhoE
MARVLYLARHGETDWNLEGRWQGHTDVALNAAGREQARTLGLSLRGRAITSVCASDLLRARETAETVAALLGVGEVAVDRDLRERSFGIFEGLTREECATRHPEHWARYRSDHLMPPGAEPHDALARRMHEAVCRAVAGREDEGATLVVSHGGSIRALVAHATGTMPPPLANVAVFRAVVTRDGLTEATLLL